MSTVKLSIIYYSSTGTNYQMALAAKQAAEDTGAEVRLRKVQELAPQAAIDSNPAWKQYVEESKDIQVAGLDDLDWADAYLFGAPTRFGNVASQMKQFIDTTGPLWAQGKLSNKAVAAFTSAQNPHGGQESTLLALYNTFHHWGSIIVPPGYTDAAVFAAGGNPYGVSTSANGEPVSAAVLDAVRYMTRRLVKVAGWIKTGQG
ncbi:MAG: NAD(P)H:quinone oxidoreductase [Chloroflexi bacterium]|nr:NAD(P)H:quinone oxidoreductase [Chloroflexota bacterium]